MIHILYTFSLYKIILHAIVFFTSMRFVSYIHYVQFIPFLPPGMQLIDIYCIWFSLFPKKSMNASMPLPGHI